MLLRISIFLLTIGVTVLGACSRRPAASSAIEDELTAAAASSPSGSPGRAFTAYDLSTLPARAGKLDWGLALSGGGIRSATYNVGVMKALFDAGILDSVDVISSVSGGGYASYWLYTNSQQRAEDT